MELPKDESRIQIEVSKDINLDAIDQEIEDLFSKIVVSGSANQIKYNLNGEIVLSFNIAICL